MKYKFPPIEKFKVGQLIIHREDWKEKAGRLDNPRYNKPYRVTKILNKDCTDVYLEGFDGKWTYQAITAYKPNYLPEDLFTL